MTLPPADEHGEELEWQPLPARDNYPAISPRTRTRVYVACLVLDVLIVLASGLAGVFRWLPPEQAAAAGVLVLAAVNAVSAGLGVAYRPTRPGAPR